MECKVINAYGADKTTAEVTLHGNMLVVTSALSLEQGDAIIDAVPPALRPWRKSW